MCQGCVRWAVLHECVCSIVLVHFMFALTNSQGCCKWCSLHMQQHMCSVGRMQGLDRCMGSTSKVQLFITTCHIDSSHMLVCVFAWVSVSGGACFSCSTYSCILLEACFACSSRGHISRMAYADQAAFDCLLTGVAGWRVNFGSDHLCASFAAVVDAAHGLVGTPICGEGKFFVAGGVGWLGPPAERALDQLISARLSRSETGAWQLRIAGKTIILVVLVQLQFECVCNFTVALGLQATTTRPGILLTSLLPVKSRAGACTSATLDSSLVLFLWDQPRFFIHLDYLSC